MHRPGASYFSYTSLAQSKLLLQIAQKIISFFFAPGNFRRFSTGTGWFLIVRVIIALKWMGKEIAV